jgi:predicted house-cleaning noncanonical NTP pyrophosphatase (MazG superfamily)
VAGYNRGADTGSSSGRTTGSDPVNLGSSPSPVTNMKKKYYHQKLIRDRIPERIKETGDVGEIRVLGKVEFGKELKRKLIEESKELAEAPKKELLNELADVLELTRSVASHFKIPFFKVEKFRAEKRKKRGGFKKRLFLVWSTGKGGK